MSVQTCARAWVSFMCRLLGSVSCTGDVAFSPHLCPQLTPFFFNFLRQAAMAHGSHDSDISGYVSIS